MGAIALEGAVALVTGGARGIGRATAAELALRGARVAIGDRDSAAAQEAAADLGVSPFELDVSDRASFGAFLAAAEGELGPPDVLVNNAGIMPLGAFLDEDFETSDATIAVNLGGVVNGMRLALPGMLERGRGHVVNVASMMGKLHVPGAAVYGATKHAVVALGDAVRDELPGDGVTITTVLPSAVRTDLVAGVPLGAGMPTVEPEEVARAIADSCRGRPAEVHVPRWLAAYEPAAALVPGPVMGLARRLLRHDRVLTDLDPGARAGYDGRVRGA
jgi:NADP-dependent 3-hydroxy acid dehydrogenase YdfG